MLLYSNFAKILLWNRLDLQVSEEVVLANIQYCTVQCPPGTQFKVACFQIRRLDCSGSAINPQVRGGFEDMWTDFHVR